MSCTEHIQSAARKGTMQLRLKDANEFVDNNNIIIIKFIMEKKCLSSVEMFIEFT